MRLLAALLMGALLTLAIAGCAGPNPSDDGSSQPRKELDRSGGGGGGMM